MPVAPARRQSRAGSAVCSLFFTLLLGGMTACASTERVVYDSEGVRIGIETDPSVVRSHQPVNNAQPAHVTADDVTTLLGAIRVSGWSGTIAGIFGTPPPVPLLTEAQLQGFSAHLSHALGEAGPAERVLFSFPKPGVDYSEDRTTGAMFLRGRYLHVVVTDHSSVIQADTGGGDLKDIRDTKGMKLWIAKPAVEAMVPDAEEPRWAPFETVHISLNVKEVLALHAANASAGISRDRSIHSPTSDRLDSSQPDLQNQIRELTNSNQELRGRLDEQKAQMKGLTEDLNRLRLELDQNKAASPPSRKNPKP